MSVDDSRAEPTQDLIAAAKAGDVSAWNQLDGRFREALKLFMRGRIPQHAKRQFETDDVLQSGMLLAFRELSSYEYRGKGSFYGWLTRILHNRLTSRMRSMGAQCRDNQRENYSQELNEALASGWLEASPSELAAEAERLATLVEAISTLEEDEREILLMHFFDKRSITAISSELELSPRTIKRKLSVALEQLGRRVQS
ncbi:MAG: RNA polymerase sigma factor (sigma-70 family) [Planctomycetota bacterium]|jgi:RNA polymerase sigma factor (sigma-70 family)